MPDPEVDNRIKDLREPRLGLDAVLKKHEEKHRKKHGTFAEASFISAFAATKTLEPENPLVNSFIADTGADSHIINSSHRSRASRKDFLSEILAS